MYCTTLLEQQVFHESRCVVNVIRCSKTYIHLATYQSKRIFPSMDVSVLRMCVCDAYAFFGKPPDPFLTDTGNPYINHTREEMGPLTGVGGGMEFKTHHRGLLYTQMQRDYRYAVIVSKNILM